MEKERKIELLAPARDLATAMAAVDHGADAVYMGAPRFGARQAAGNTVDDIARAVEYARMFGARVYATLNTIVREEELEDAERMAREVADAGVDALIVQDMAYMEMGLEGVELHASTQTFNASPEKVAFLGRAGFSRVVLERNISFDDIRRIRRSTDVELECFVHGAICVAYSGRCYMSRTMSARSGNRGDCSQACRLPYDLVDDYGRVLRRDRHLLSVCDLDLSGRIGDLIDAGVSSLKIEGRLKDINYVKNVVAWYRRKVDEALAVREGVCRSSVGESRPGFEPDMDKTFSRRASEYFFDGRRAGVGTPDSPKATGELFGKVTASGRDWFETDSTIAAAPGDGICVATADGLAGTNINRVEGVRLFPNRMPRVRRGDAVYRNFDRRFAALLEASRSRRTIATFVRVAWDGHGLSATFIDCEGVTATVTEPCSDGPARDAERAAAMIAAQLARSGDTPFRIERVEMPAGGKEQVPFVRIGQVNDLRRRGLDALAAARLARPVVRNIPAADEGARWPFGKPDGSENIVNSAARLFYARHGAPEAEPGYDLRDDLRGVTVIRTPYCIRRENGMCLRYGGKPGTLRLRHEQHVYRLEFDCAECIMRVVYEGRTGRKG